MQKQLNDKTLDKQFDFLREIDQLKSVIRKSSLIDQSRKENSAEHSWNLAMYALILKGSSEKEINIERVIKMLLIHDIVEIDAGDHRLHETIDNSLQEEAERKAADVFLAYFQRHKVKSSKPTGTSLKPAEVTMLSLRNHWIVNSHSFTMLPPRVALG